MKSIKEIAENNLRENGITEFEHQSYTEGARFGVGYVLRLLEDLPTKTMDVFDLIRSLREQNKV